MLVWLILLGIYTAFIGIVSFIANIPVMLATSVLIVAGIVVVYFLFSALGPVLVLIPVYWLPALIIVIVIALIFGGFDPGRMFKTALCAILLEIGFFVAWTSMPVEPIETDDVHSIEIASDQASIRLTDTIQVQELLDSMTAVEYKHGFDEWVDSPCQYKLYLCDSNENKIQEYWIFSSKDIAIVNGDKMKYYVAKNEDLPTDIMSSYISPIENEMEYNEMMEAVGTQIRSFENSIKFKNGIISFTIPKNMPEGWTLKVNATESQGGVYVKKDFLQDVEWQEGKTYEMEIGDMVFSNLNLQLKLGGYSYKVDLLNILPESQKDIRGR